MLHMYMYYHYTAADTVHHSPHVILGVSLYCEPLVGSGWSVVVVYRVLSFILMEDGGEHHNFEVACSIV